MQDAVSLHFKEVGTLMRGLAVLGELTPRSMDAIASFGERLSTLILAHVFEERGIPSQLMDSRQFIITDDNFTRAAPLFDLTDAAIREQLAPAIKNGKFRSFRDSSARPATESQLRLGGEGRTIRPRLWAPLSMPTTFRSGPTWTAS